MTDMGATVHHTPLPLLGGFLQHSILQGVELAVQPSVNYHHLGRQDYPQRVYCCFLSRCKVTPQHDLGKVVAELSCGIAT